MVRMRETDGPSRAPMAHAVAPQTAMGTATAGAPKLLDRLREALRSRHYRRRTEQTYRDWVKRFIYFHNIRHPAEMAEAEINAFLTHLAVKTTMIYTHVLNHGPAGVRSPVDGL